MSAFIGTSSSSSAKELTSEELQTLLNGCPSVKSDLNLVIISLRRRCATSTLPCNACNITCSCDLALQLLSVDSSVAHISVRRPHWKFFVIWYVCGHVQLYPPPADSFSMLLMFKQVGRYHFTCADHMMRVVRYVQ
jgi:hypothetical protein